MDSILALFLLIVSVVPQGVIVDILGHAPDARISLTDAGFGLAFIFLWHSCFSVLRLYDRNATFSARVLSAPRGALMMILPVMAYLWLRHPECLTLSAVLTTVGGWLSLEVSRILVSVTLRNWLASRNPRRALIIGSGPRAGKAWRALRTHYHASVRLIGFVDDRDPTDLPADLEHRFLGTVNQLSDLLLKEVVDVILIAMPIQSCYPLMQRAVHIAESAGVQVLYLDDIYSRQQRLHSKGETVFRDLVPQQETDAFRLAAKRALDLCGAFLGLVVLSPLFLIIALGIKLTSRGPVLHFQERYGYRRRRFRLMKFRSMVRNAEQLLPALENVNEATGPLFKMKNDPRVTRFGKFLRVTSLDELPQLWNVLIGEMSLVGPRPMTIRDVSLFSEAALMRRFSVKPGMTGLLQVSGRSAVGFDEWIVMDNRYIDRWSLSLDVKILARTVGTVIKRHGAM
jgi:exopolysaccharide biosynthesis polyprenyl glycosylphosphotransferase